MSLPTFDTPSIGPRQGKVWGCTQLGLAFNGVEAHAVHIKAGGFCSKHKHVSKWNRFHVLSGKLMVTIFRPGKDVDEEDATTISVGQITDVPPGVYHQFEAIEDTVAIEYYWTLLDVRDIERVSEGGVR